MITRINNTIPPPARALKPQQGWPASQQARQEVSRLSQAGTQGKVSDTKRPVRRGFRSAYEGVESNVPSRALIVTVAVCRRPIGAGRAGVFYYFYQGGFDFRRLQALDVDRRGGLPQAVRDCRLTKKEALKDTQAGRGVLESFMEGPAGRLRTRVSRDLGSGRHEGAPRAGHAGTSKRAPRHLRRAGPRRASSLVAAAAPRRPSGAEGQGPYEVLASAPTTSTRARKLYEKLHKGIPRQRPGQGRQGRQMDRPGRPPR